MEANQVSKAAAVVKAGPDSMAREQGKAISSASLFALGSNEIVIEHYGEWYRLRQTRNGKLILTK